MTFGVDPEFIRPFKDLRQQLLDSECDVLEPWAASLRDEGHGTLQTFSPKVFIPLTQLCRNVCHYCTFAKQPRDRTPAFLSRDAVLDIARAGAQAGCREALFTLGDRPEARYSAARVALAALGHASTISYLAEVCALVLKSTGLLPHVNAGVLTRDETALLRTVSVSQGLMLESASDRLTRRGGPHYGSPDKRPSARLEAIRIAGELRVPFTSGILIGIGETREERLDALFALHDLHARYGHIQEIIVQNFRAKPGTRMAGFPEPSLDDLRWTIAAARIVFGPSMSIQTPPNLSADYGMLLGAGLNDWGGISPVTCDHVNPEAAWPHLDDLRASTRASGRQLAERLPVYPAYIRDSATWLDASLVAATLRSADACGLARDHEWAPGLSVAAPVVSRGPVSRPTLRIREALDHAAKGGALPEEELVALFEARGDDVHAICAAANDVRMEACGDEVTFAVNRNLNYTNICSYQCRFCAFSKGRGHESLRGAPYDLAMEEVSRRVAEAWERGATEICLQGGIHPDYTGEKYLDILRTVKAAAPGIHVHAFSPLEVSHGAATLGMDLNAYLLLLREAGLGSLPGTAAEILDDEVRAVLCPDKLSSRQWLDVVEAAHGVGLPTTATIMFGHIDRPVHWARHLLRIRALQQRTGGFTEFVPLPFVHMEAPLNLQGRSRKGPTYRETLLMHAIARLALHPVIRNIQASWVKLGREGLADMLTAGVNDIGGTLMNESISRAAGTEHGQEFAPGDIIAFLRAQGRTPRQRTTLYGPADPERQHRALGAMPLSPIILTPPRKRRREDLVSAIGEKRP